MKCEEWTIYQKTNSTSIFLVVYFKIQAGTSLWVNIEGIVRDTKYKGKGSQNTVKHLDRKWEYKAVLTISPSSLLALAHPGFDIVSYVNYRICIPRISEPPTEAS